MIDFGDTAFMLICSALVFIMTPGLGFFYGGLGRRKNMVNNLMSSFFILALGITMWVLVGYSLAFGGNTGGIIGTLDFIGLKGLGVDEPSGYLPTIPALAFAGFQMTFALITPALITGSVAGRMRFPALFLFIAFWSLIVYYPLAHMVWGEGGIIGTSIGAVDFAGGTVVHISAGVTGLVLSLLLGKRIGYDHQSYKIHHVPFVALGAAMLWFGWYGFNAGSAGAASGLAAHAFMTTSAAAAAAFLAWILIDVIRSGKPTLIGACTGIVVGLVSITPAAGFVPLWSALIIGAAGSVFCYGGVALIKRRLKIDDALDAFGCHGIGGLWGCIATGIFANPAINDLASEGLYLGGVKQFIAQLISIVISVALAAAGTLAAAGLTRIFTSLRVSRTEELSGLDMTQHGESAYPSFNGLD